MTKTDRTLISGIAQGESEALAAFYRQWFDFIYSQARRMTSRDEQFCLDVVQEVMMRVIQFNKKIDSEAAVAKWLRAVTLSCCVDALRRETRRGRRERQRANSTPASEHNGNNQDQIDWLRHQLSMLEPETARLLTLRFRFGWTLQRIGSIVGLSTGAVDGKISRSLAQIKANAGENSPDA